MAYHARLLPMIGTDGLLFSLGYIGKLNLKFFGRWIV